MDIASHRRGISGGFWEIINPHLPGKGGIGVARLPVMPSESVLIGEYVVNLLIVDVFPSRLKTGLAGGFFTRIFTNGKALASKSM